MSDVVILYESENFIVVDKPYDMYINSDDENETNTVTSKIASGDSHLSSSTNQIHFVQRLDYATSGVLCMAKNKSSAAQAGKLFESRKTSKYYLAVVRGHVQFELSDIVYDVGQDPETAETSHRMVARLSEKSLTSLPRSAHTRMLKLETGYYDRSPVTIVLLKPITGRRHQLRVHSAAIGHIILGDYTYSGATDCTPHRMYLHATRLVLPIPNEHLDIQTPEPFLSDPRFSSKYTPAFTSHQFRSKEDFLEICGIIDKDYVLGVSYKLFTMES